MRQIDVIILIGIVAMLAFSLLVILPWRLRRAVRLVIKAFIENNATSPKSAIPQEKLRIKPSPGMLNWRIKLRDFKNEALNLLLQMGAVQRTEDGNLYLVEDKINFTKLGKSRSYYRGE